MRMNNTQLPAKRRAVNLSIHAVALDEAKSLGLNTSRIADAAIKAAVREEKKRRFVEANREAIAYHHRWVEKNGTIFTPLWMQDDGSV